MSGVATSDLQPPQCYPRHTPVPRSHQLTVFCDFDGPIVDVSKRYYSTYQLGLADTQEFYQRQGITLPIQRLQKQQFWQMKQDRVPGCRNCDALRFTGGANRFLFGARD
jgi:hypothetical protein